MREAINEARDEVLDFISNMLALAEPNAAAFQRVFLCGYCYWFAYILKERFDGTIYYFPVRNHFITRIRGKYYDVTGEVSGEGAESWKLFRKKDPLLTMRLYRDCILKLRSNEDGVYLGCE